MTTKRNPEILHAFFCESLRAEMTGQVTAIGMYGETIKFPVTPPTMLSTFSFHANIRNVDHVGFNAKVRITFPGGNPPFEAVVPVKSETAQDTQFFNLNFAAIQIKELGEIVARVELDTVPPAVREFRLRIEFQPGLSLAAPVQTQLIMQAPGKP